MRTAARFLSSTCEREQTQCAHARACTCVHQDRTVPHVTTHLSSTLRVVRSSCCSMVSCRAKSRGFAPPPLPASWLPPGTLAFPLAVSVVAGRAAEQRDSSYAQVKWQAAATRIQPHAPWCTSLVCGLGSGRRNSGISGLHSEGRRMCTQHCNA